MLNIIADMQDSKKGQLLEDKNYPTFVPPPKKKSYTGEYSAPNMRNLRDYKAARLKKKEDILRVSTYPLNLFVKIKKIISALKIQRTWRLIKEREEALFNKEYNVEITQEDMCDPEPPKKKNNKSVLFKENLIARLPDMNEDITESLSQDYKKARLEAFGNVITKWTGQWPVPQDNFFEKVDGWISIVGEENFEVLLEELVEKLGKRENVLIWGKQGSNYKILSHHYQGFLFCLVKWKIYKMNQS